MIHLKAETFNALYHPIVCAIREHGVMREPRGQLCRELRPAAFTVTNPKRGLYTGGSRRLNYTFWAVETLSYIAGWGDRKHAQLMCAVNKNMSAWVNSETGAFDGAYGPRLRSAIPGIIDLLKRDPDSRQGVASIWSPGSPYASLDIPCTVMLHFYMEDEDHLGLTVYMRSNDADWGLPYDVAAFCALQVLVADCLCKHAGRYHQVDGSLHYYESHVPNVLPVDEELFGVVRTIPEVSYNTPPSYATIAYSADLLLKQLHDHVVVDGRSPKLFEPSLECDDYYLRRWCDYIRLGRC